MCPVTFHVPTLTSLYTHRKRPADEKPNGSLLPYEHPLLEHSWRGTLGFEIASLVAGGATSLTAAGTGAALNIVYYALQKDPKVRKQYVDMQPKLESLNASQAINDENLL